jgi:hypothetical protein
MAIVVAFDFIPALPGHSFRSSLAPFHQQVETLL